MKSMITLLTVALCVGAGFGPGFGPDSGPGSGLLFGLAVETAHAQDGLEVTAEDLYYEARSLLREGRYLDAAEGFAAVSERYGDSDLAPMALYWRAFALSRDGERRSLLEAKSALESLFERYPAEARRGDSAELAIEIRGQLAERGDADAAREIAALAETIRGGESDGDEPTSWSVGRSEGRMNEETRLAALNALLQMSPERARPILRRILIDDASEYSDEFRERAIFLISQNGGGSDETLAVLEHVIENDPSSEVREQAVFWLSQTNDERAVDILETIALDADADPEVRDKAIFALSQVGGTRATRILRDIALDPASSTELRGQAVFWIGQSGNGTAYDFLVQLFDEVDDPEIKDKAIFSISQLGGSHALDFFERVVRDESEPIEVRKQAFFWMGQLAGDHAPVDLVLRLLRTVDARELREQAVFVLSQIDSAESVAAMIEIAREEDDPELRDKAIFWLGQSNRDEAAEFLVQLIEEDF